MQHMLTIHKSASCINDTQSSFFLWYGLWYIDIQCHMKDTGSPRSGIPVSRYRMLRMYIRSPLTRNTQ